MTLKKVAIAVGTLTCHSMSLICDWRQISTYTISLPIIAIILTSFWPESPSYLAMKGRFRDCKESFLWLNGESNLSELNHLITTHMERMKIRKPENRCKSLLKKDFLKPLAIVSLLTLVIDLCGRYYFVVYIIQIMVELFGDKSLAIYCSIAVDCFTIIALVSSCFVIRRFKRRTLLFSSGMLTVVLMLLISLLILLKAYNIGIDIVWLTPLMIVLQSFVVNFGVIPIGFAIIGEIFPLEYKGVGSCISGIVFTILYTLTLKITPMLLEHTGVGGTYATYGVCMAVSMVLLHFVVPETKDKTLQQIEDEIKGVKTTECKVETNTLL